MKLLVLSFYFRPDLSAGSFRTTALVEKLKLQNEHLEIEIITTMPNRYESFVASAEAQESDGNVIIRRVMLPPHKSGLFDQARSFSAYFFAVKKMTKNNSYDLVYATSSRLFTAFLGAIIARKKKIPLYLDVRDIFVDTVKSLFSFKVLFVINPILYFIEKFTFSQASHINLVSQGFRDYFLSRFDKASYSWFTNGIDEEFISNYHDHVQKSDQDAINILYAGNLGAGQGLHYILPRFLELLDEKYVLTVVGDGGCRLILEEKLSKFKNVTIKSPVNRKDLVNLYNEVDILFLHLDNLPAFEKVLPSKIFEYAATGKPILAGVNGYAREFIVKEVNNAEIFKPNDGESAIDALAKLVLKNTNRSEFIKKFDRSNIMAKMAGSVINVGSLK